MKIPKEIQKLLDEREELAMSLTDGLRPAEVPNGKMMEEALHLVQTKHYMLDGK